MHHRKTRIASACSTVMALATLATLATLGGCGSDGDADATAAPASVSISSSVIDGAIGNALVCLDQNANGACDTGEPQSRSRADGSVTLTVAAADVGRFSLLALVGPDAVDADHGAVTTRYVLSAPADQTAVVSPLTTLVQHTATSNGVSSAEAAAALQAGTGLTTSPFADYTRAAPPADGSLSAQALARLLVLTAQAQASALAPSLGSTAIDGKAISQSDIDRAIQQGLAAQLADLSAGAAAAQAQANGDSAALNTALAAAAPALAADSGLTTGSIATAVGVANQASAGAAAPAAPAASVQLANLAYTDAGSWHARLLTSSLAQNTPDADNRTRYVDRRIRSSNGAVATWSHAADPWRQSDSYWTGSAWVQCGINHPNSSTLRNAQGVSRYDFCASTGTSRRAVFGVAGRTMASVYQQIRDARSTNISIADPAVLGNAVFPGGAELLYHSNTELTSPIAYQPTGKDSPVGTSAIVSQYSAAVADGGDGRSQPAGTGCNSPETQTNGVHATTLEAMVAVKKGTPCVFAEGSFTYQGATYRSGPSNIWWGNSSVGIGKLGTAPVNSGPAPGYYTGNTLLRASFPGANAVTYHACQERFNNGSPRNCSTIGSGSYRIETLGDARAMILSSAPAQAAALSYDRVFVERGGYVHFGYRVKPTTTESVRLNNAAARALLAQLAIPVDDPEQPLALTAWSYQGTWDLRAAGPVVANDGTTLFINGDGTVSCQDKANGQSFACTLTVTDPTSGAFAYSGGGTTATGSFAHLAQTASGTVTEAGSSGSFVGGRR